MHVVNTPECLSQAENGQQQLHVAYGICGSEYSPFSLSLWYIYISHHGHMALNKYTYHIAHLYPTALLDTPILYTSIKNQ